MTTTSVIRTPTQFVSWLRTLRLPREPQFDSEESEAAWMESWRVAFKNETDAGFEALRYYLLPTLKRFPTIAEVMEVLGQIKRTGQTTHNPQENQRSFGKFNGADVFPGYSLATPEQVEAIEKNMPRSSPLPTVYMRTGDIYSGGRKVGNLRDYEVDEKIRKLKKLNRAKENANDVAKNKA